MTCHKWLSALILGVCAGQARAQDGAAAESLYHVTVRAARDRRGAEDARVAALQTLMRYASPNFGGLRLRADTSIRPDLPPVTVAQLRRRERYIAGYSLVDHAYTVPSIHDVEARVLAQFDTIARGEDTNRIGTVAKYLFEHLQRQITLKEEQRVALARRCAAVKDVVPIDTSSIRAALHLAPGCGEVGGRVLAAVWRTGLSIDFDSLMRASYETPSDTLLAMLSDMVRDTTQTERMRVDALRVIASYVIPAFSHIEVDSGGAPINVSGDDIGIFDPRLFSWVRLFICLPCPDAPMPAAKREVTAMLADVIHRQPSSRFGNVAYIVRSWLRDDRK